MLRVPSLPPQHAFGLACPLRVDVPACGLFQLVVCQCLQPDAGRLLLACWGGVPDTLSNDCVCGVPTTVIGACDQSGEGPVGFWQTGSTNLYREAAAKPHC